MSDLIGQSLGRYHILEQLGEGGMATVYKAYDTRLETEVAVKVIRTESIPPNILERALKRFEREAKALARLNHLHIVKVTDYGEYEGKPYLVMPYLPGGTLKQKMGKPMPWQEAIQLLIPIAEALGYAHSQNMIHRDVKPSNILLTERGEPLLTDFGIAKILDLEETLELTGTSAAVGTPEYMAPEQATAKTADHRADIYALGVVLYELITGRKPFVADTPLAVLIKHASEALPRPRQFVSSLPDRVEKVLLKALAKSPDERYQSMAEMEAAFKSLLSVQVKNSIQQKRFEEPNAGSVKVKTLQVGTRRRWNASIIVILLGIGAATIVGLLALPRIEKWFSPVPLPTSSAAATEYLVSPTMPAPTSTEALVSQKLVTPSLIASEGFVSSPTPLPTEVVDAVGAKMELVPAGEFTMGSENGDPDERPIHQVYLDAFYLDKYEVTNALYKACVSADVCQPPKTAPRAYQLNYYGKSKYDKFPVVYLDWKKAKTYCEWRGAKLPNEAQWEKAARGADGRTYPWGEEIDCNYANYYGCVGDITEVGSYESGQSPYGIYDLAGNALEWVADWYSDAYYQNSSTSNPLGPENGNFMVLRGGAWNDDRFSVRGAHRFNLNPLSISYQGWYVNHLKPDNSHWTTYYYYTGVRCARDANP